MSRTPLAVALMALLPCLCVFEVFTGALLLPTDWLYHDVEPWRTLKRPAEVQNARIKDAILDGYALDVVSARAAREGHVLLWNPYAGGGIPHLAAGFSRMLYPPFWVYALLPPEHARSAEILIHLFLAEAFAFLFLRKLGADIASALLGAVTFGFTPSIAHRAEVPFILPTLVWFPLLLYFVEGLVTSGRYAWCAGLATVVALQILPGHYPDMFVHFLGAGVYAACRFVTCRDRASAFARAVLGLAAFVLGASLAAPFLFPSLELIGHANRAVTPPEGLAATGLPPHAVLLSLFSPLVQRSQLYVGLLPLVFVPAAFAKVTRGPAWALLALMLLGLAISTGSPLLQLLYWAVPALGRLRYVETLVSLASFSLALLAGLGMAAAAGGSLKRERALGWLLFGLVSIGTLVAWGAGRGDAVSFFRAPLALIVVGAGALGLELRSRGVLVSSALTTLLLVLVSLDLMSYLRDFNPRVDGGAFPPFPRFAAIEFMKRDPERFRVATLRGETGRAFPPNTLGAYGLQDVSAYHSLLPHELGSYMERVRRQVGGAEGVALLEERDPSSNLAYLTAFRPSNLLRVWNIKYFILPRGEPNPDPESLDLVYDGEVRLLLYRDRLPRAWLARSARVVPGELAAYQALAEPAFDPARDVVLETEPACSFGTPGAPVDAHEAPAATIAEYHPESIRVETRSPTPAFLVLSESYDPGWVARVDGQPATVMKAELHFRAVPLAAGAHRVEFSYEPPSYRWGWYASGCAVLILFALAFVFRFDPRFVAGTLVLAALPPAIGLAGWRRAETSRQPPCGQLQVRERLFGDDVRVTGPDRPRMRAREMRVPSTLTWPLKMKEPALLRVRVALTSARFEDVAVARVLLRRDSVQRVLTESLVRGGAARWNDLEVPVPSGGGTLVLEAMADRPAFSVLWGNPIVLAPGPRQPSVIHFALGPPRLATAPSPDRFGMALGVAPGLAEVAALDEADIVAPAAFSDEMIGRIPDLYRVASVFLVAPRNERESPAFAWEQLNVLRRRLRRFGLGPQEVTLDIDSAGEREPR